MFVNKSTLTIFQRSAAVSTLCNRYSVLNTKTASSQEPDWNRAISEAEKVVAYPPASFLNRRWLFRDEIVNITQHLRKLDGSNNDFLNTAKNLFYNGLNSVQTWELIILLISKAAGQQNLKSNDMEKNTEAGIVNSQRVLAEITEMIRIGFLMHENVVNIQEEVDLQSLEMYNSNFGNKILLLSGDYLLGNSFAAIAALKIKDLLELMSSTIKDLAEAEFIGRRDSQNNPLPSVPPTDRTAYAVKEWTIRNLLTAGTLLGKSCKGTLKIAGHNEEIQEHGYNFGIHLILTWQARLDLSQFISKNRNTPFNLCSAPVMFHIEHDPSILIEIDKGLESVQNVDYGKIFDIIVSGPGIELTQQLQLEHLQRAMEVLNIFQESDARTALSNILVAMREF